MKNSKNYEQTHAQIQKIRRLYSEIGEPLDDRTIVELYLHLGDAIKAVSDPKPMPEERRRLC